MFSKVILDGTENSANIRMPQSNSPVTDVTSIDIRCNVDPAAATDTVEVAAGASITFIADNTMGHPGPAAIYLGQVPSGSTAAEWDGSSAAWFKIAELGAAGYNPLTFEVTDTTEVSGTLPSDIADGDVRAYLQHCPQYMNVV